MTGPNPSLDAASRALTRDGSVDLVGKLRRGERSMGEIRLLAFAGHPEAEEVWLNAGGIPDCVSPGAEPCECGDMARWAPFLQRLWAKLPPHRVEVPRRHRPTCRSATFPVGEFAQCDCRLLPKTSSLEVPADRWGMVAVAVAVALTCWREGANRYSVPSGEAWIVVRHTIDAGSAWVAEPSHERLTSWLRLEDASMPSWALLSGLVVCDAPFFSRAVVDALHAAAKAIGPDRVREVASQAVVQAVLG